jgi:putative endonuclease
MGILSRFRLFRETQVPLGLMGERYAARWLRWRGFKIVAGGKRSRYGELDLVAVEKRTLVFIEVKTRRTDSGGHPADAVGPDKQRRIVRSALAFMKEHGLLEHPCRFDVVTLVWPEEARKPSIQHFRSAFEATGHASMFS